jgi:hypothetical protein
MRTTIRRNPNMTYDQQMYMREQDAERSRLHPNGIANTHRQRAESAERRSIQEAQKNASGLARTERRRAKRKKV